MSAIADSSAVLDRDRTLPQHLAALALIQDKIGHRDVVSFRWLDLATGKGQIIAQLKNNLNEKLRAKLYFTGFDVDTHNTRACEQLASSMGFASYTLDIGELATFHSSSKTAGPWDFITLTNTIHEIAPLTLAGILAAAIERLNDKGCLFVYDMDRLESPELGAVLWTGAEFAEILAALCNALGCKDYEPIVGQWSHRTCNGWNAHLNREHMQLPTNWRSEIPKAVQATEARIREILQRKLQHTTAALEALTRFGAQTGEEAKGKEELLHNYWAITRAMGT